MTDAHVITRLLHAIDTLDWETARSCLADEVRTDYTSLFPSEVETVTADDLVVRWQGRLPGFDATQHLTGPVLVSDGVAHTHVRARHWLSDTDGGDTWTVYGHYVVGMTDGKIAALTLQTFRQEGNQNLPVIAAERAASSPRVS